MGRVMTLARSKPAAEHWLAHAEALVLARSGRLQAAQASSSRAVDLALQRGERTTAANYQAARAVLEVIYGNAAAARVNATRALELSNGRDTEYTAGLALALSGDSARSQALADDLERALPRRHFRQV